MEITSAHHADRSCQPSINQSSHHGQVGRAGRHGREKEKNEDIKKALHADRYAHW
jgi:hypothetical protein